MTKRETLFLAFVLVAAAIALHALHYLIFGDARHIAIYLLGDIAFLPVEVLFVTLVVDRLLSGRERAARQHKMNMVIGVFFTELGRPLLATLRSLTTDGKDLLKRLQLAPQTGEKELRQAIHEAHHLSLSIALTPGDMRTLKDLVHAHQALTLQLLANSTLLEHEAFTDVLWAVAHLEEELMARQDLDHLPESDVIHIEGDVQRVYRRLLSQWLEYLLHLHKFYPYLYSFAVRADPLQEGLSPEVVERV
ncbi:MAG: hypothetical protein ABFE07_27665 [Armatimonadia bacterium]